MIMVVVVVMMGLGLNRINSILITH